MKYQSELIAEIVDKRGHETSSLHYESECIQTWIDEAKGGYPKLCDYQSEWLYYINKNPIGDFPYETLTDITEATVNHVVPYSYKSAILKGQTLVNRVSSYGFGGDRLLYEARFFDNPFQKGETITVFVVNPNVTTIKVGSHSEETGNWLTDITYDVSINKKINYIVPNDTIVKYVGVVVNNENDSSGFENSIVVVNGDQSHLNINTYFEGMQSVKMPVLTTSNGDGTKTNILTVNEDVTLRSNGSVYDELDLLTGKLTQRIDEDGSVLTQEVVKTVDLSCVNQNGENVKFKPIEGTMHIATDGTPIKPTFTGEIPVEAITQNLASFIEE